MRKHLPILLALLFVPLAPVLARVTVNGVEYAGGLVVQSLTSSGAISGTTGTFSSTISGTTVTATTTGNGPAVSVTGVPSGQSAIEVTAGSRIWLDGSTHTSGLANNNGRVYFLGGANSASDLIVGTTATIGTGISITTGGTRPVRQTLGTCASGIEGTIQTDVLSGAATGKRTKVCLCTSDGASTYAWQNIATATIGTTTACGTE